MIKEGYKKVASSEPLIHDTVCKLMLRWSQSKPGLFKIPAFRRWVVLAAGAELIEDVKRAPDDILSTHEATREVCTMCGFHPRSDIQRNHVSSLRWITPFPC